MLLEDINKLQDVVVSGTVGAISGMMLECSGIERLLSIGARCRVVGAQGLNGKSPNVLAEVVGFRGDVALLMPFESIEGIGPGAKVIIEEAASVCYPSDG